MSRSAKPRIAILGAGPVGLEAALLATQSGFPVTVYERGDIGESIGRWGHVRMFTPFSANSTAQGLDLIQREHSQHKLPEPNDILTGAEYSDVYLVPLTLSSKLADCVRTKTRAVAIGRLGLLQTDAANDPRRASAPFRLLLQDGGGVERFEEADVIFDCTGTFPRHAWIGEGGIPAAGEMAAEKQIAYGLEDVLGKNKAQYAGKCTVVVGGGYSAATTIVALSQLAEQNNATWSIWLTRGQRSTPLPRIPNDPFRERDRLAAKANNLATRGDGNVEIHPQMRIDEVVSHGPDKGFRVSGRCNGKPMTWEVDRVIGNVGSVADSMMSRELHVEECEPGEIRRREPGYFVLGAKSYGRSAEFLLKRGFEQVKEALAIISKS